MLHVTNVETCKCYSFQILIALECCRYIWEKFSNNKFHENPSTWTWRTDRQTDMMKLIVAFRNFSNAPKRITTRLIQMETLNTFYLVIYWTWKVHNSFIFLCSIVLPATCRPLFKPSPLLLKQTRHSSCGSNFYCNFKVSFWLSLVYSNSMC